MRPSKEFDHYLVQCMMQRDALDDLSSNVHGMPQQDHAKRITSEVERHAQSHLKTRIELWEDDFSPDPHAYPSRKVIVGSVAIVPGRAFRKMLGMIDQLHRDNGIAWRHRSEIEDKAEKRAADAEACVRELEARIAAMDEAALAWERGR